MDYINIFENLWIDYKNINPSVEKIHTLLTDAGNAIINDHIALRTYNIEGMNIETLALPFKELGYIEKGHYSFEEKKLNAKHYEHESDSLAPKVFISELITEEFSALVQQTAKWIAKIVQQSKRSAFELLFTQRLWGPINYVSYEALRKESEYAAWFYVFGFKVNHFTILINQLNSINNIEEMNIFLKKNGFMLNASGGEIKGSEAEFLKQSSTLADKVLIEFEDGVHEIPCCYYEFAERFKINRNDLFSGFIEKSANKIFESTDMKDVRSSQE
jgi:hypothetical protein